MIERSTPNEADLLDTLTGVTPESPLAELRSRREAVMQHTQGSYDAIFAPVDATGLSLEERAMAGLRVAVLTHSAPFIDHYRGLLTKLKVDNERVAEIAGTPSAPPLSAREVALLRHVEMMSNEPRAASKAQIAELERHGFSPRDIVTLAQLVAFVHFQVRVLAGLQMIGENL